MYFYRSINSIECLRTPIRRLGNRVVRHSCQLNCYFTITFSLMIIWSVSPAQRCSHCELRINFAKIITTAVLGTPCRAPDHCSTDVVQSLDFVRHWKTSDHCLRKSSWWWQIFPQTAVRRVSRQHFRQQFHWFMGNFSDATRTYFWNT